MKEQKTTFWSNFKKPILISVQIIKINETLTTKCDFTTTKNNFPSFKTYYNTLGPSINE